MRIFLSFLVVFVQLTLFGKDCKIVETPAVHLLEVNKEWNLHLHSLKRADRFQNVSFSTEKDRIQYHLFQVIKLLGEHSNHSLLPEQKIKREQLISVLVDYANEKKFPINIYHAQRTPYFIDYRGTHCAVGFLLLQSGEGQLAKEIANEDNYVYVRDIQKQELNQWAEKNGFTVDELALIQPSYLISNYYEPYPVGPNGVGGPNGPIITAVEHHNNNQIYFAGNFDHLGETPCDKIATYTQGVGFECFANGIQGQVRQFSQIAYGRDLAMVGRFEYEGTIYPIALYIQGRIEYVAVDGFENAEGTSVVAHNMDVYVGIKTEDNTHLLYAFYAFHAFTLENKRVVASFDGPIYALHSGLDDFLNIGGHFSQVERENEVYLSKNFIQYHNDFVVENEPYTEPYWVASQYPVPDTIRVFNQNQNLYATYPHLYIGGYATNNGSENSIFGRLLNGVYSPIVDFSNRTQSGRLNEEVRSIYINRLDEKIFFGGDLSQQLNSEGIIMYYGLNLFQYNPSTNQISPEGIFNGPVNAIFNLSGNYLDVFGEFTGTYEHPSVAVSLNYMASKTTSLSTQKVDAESYFSLYPNPTNQLINLAGDLDKIIYAEIVNLNGQIQKVQTTSFETINIESLSDGLYILKVNTKDRVVESKFVVRK